MDDLDERIALAVAKAFAMQAAAAPAAPAAPKRTKLVGAPQIMDTLMQAATVGALVFKDKSPESGDAFSSGKHGYYLGGKVLIEGRECQVSCNVIILDK